MALMHPARRTLSPSAPLRSAGWRLPSPWDVVRSLATHVSGAWDKRRQRAALERLRELDAERLADLGLTRADLDDALADPSPSRSLTAARGRNAWRDLAKARR